MKKFRHKSHLLIGVLLFAGLCFFVLPARAQGQADSQISDLNYEYADGMFNISFNLEVQNMRGKEIRIALWPVNNSTGEFVMAGAGTAGIYKSGDGHLTTQDLVIPSSDNTTWEPYVLSLPFSAFPRSTGEIDWYPYIEIRDESTHTNFLSQNSRMDYLVISNASFTDSNQPATTSYDGCDGDNDCDGISDDMEMYLAESFMPVYEYDEEEHNPITGSTAMQGGQDVVYLYQVSEVKCGVNAQTQATQFILESKNTTKNLPSWIAESNSYLFTVVATYAYDYLPYDPGTGEDDRFNHYGDTERVRICIVEDDGNYVARYLIINRHNEKELYVVSDIPYWEGSHPYLYVSEGKHATFVSNDECRGSNQWTDSVLAPLEGESWTWIGFREDCSGGIVIRPSAWKSFNIGEPFSFMPESGRITLNDMAIAGGWQYDMDPLGIEAVWSAWADDPYNRDHYFCGGIDFAEYSAEHNVAPKYDSPWCAGQLSNKWWDSSQ